SGACRALRQPRGRRAGARQAQGDGLQGRGGQRQVTWLDYGVLGVLALSIAWGAWRGLVREVMSLAGWVIAFLAANLFAAPLADYLPQAIQRPEWRTLIAFVGIFIVSLIITTFAAHLLAKILKAAGLGGLDRSLGA